MEANFLIHRWPSSHWVPMRQKGQGELFGVSFIRILIPLMTVMSSWINCFPKFLPPNIIITLWVRFQHMNCGGRGNTVHLYQELKPGSVNFYHLRYLLHLTLSPIISAGLCIHTCIFDIAFYQCLSWFANYLINMLFHFQYYPIFSYLN